jgi:hypothetical protein
MQGRDEVPDEMTLDELKAAFQFGRRWLPAESEMIPAIAAGAVVLFTAGCAHNRAHRTVLAPCDTTQTEADCTKAAIETVPEYKLGFVEFDDQGWFWNREQLKFVEKMLRAEAGIGRSNNAEGIVLVLFVHGWKNNAASDNENVHMFRAMLKELRKADQTQSGTDKQNTRKIIGVYSGWRGMSAKWEPFKELSFWERKNSAHKIGHGAMTELLADLENIQKASNRTIRPEGPRTELIILAHSFGGAAVYSAISQIVTERFVDTIERGRPLKPLGDVVILLNPAFEASRHYNLNELAVSISQYPERQRPVLAIFTSKGDWATHYVFPIGRFFSTTFEKNRPDKPQGAANRSAVGWFKPFITHNLVYDANATNATAAATEHSTLNRTTRKHEIHSRQNLQESMQNIESQRQKWRPNAPNPVVYSFDDCLLKPKDSFKPGDPFMIVSVDKKIMSGHGDISNPVLINFLREFILFCQPKPRERPE